MYELSAPNIVVAPLEPARSSFLPARVAALAGAVERLLERERAQLPLWFVVAVGAGIVGWLNLPGPLAWTGLLIAAAGILGAGLILPGSRIGRPDWCRGRSCAGLRRYLAALDDRRCAGAGAAGRCQVQRNDQESRDESGAGRSSPDDPARWRRSAQSHSTLPADRGRVRRLGAGRTDRGAGAARAAAAHGLSRHPRSCPRLLVSGGRRDGQGARPGDRHPPGIAERHGFDPIAARYTHS